MLDLKRFNYFSGEETAVSKAVFEICQIYELVGNMSILFHSRNLSDIGLHHSFQPAHSYKNIKELSNMLADKGLLFRADIIVIDAWKMKSESLDLLLEQVKNINSSFIIMSQSYHIINNIENISEYTVQSNIVHGNRNIKGFSLPLRETLINSKTEGWSATTEELKASFIRDKRLDDLLGD